MGNSHRHCRSQKSSVGFQRCLAPSRILQDPLYRLLGHLYSIKWSGMEKCAATLNLCSKALLRATWHWMDSRGYWRDNISVEMKIKNTDACLIAGEEILRAWSKCKVVCHVLQETLRLPNQNQKGSKRSILWDRVVVLTDHGLHKAGVFKPRYISSYLLLQGASQPSAFPSPLFCPVYFWSLLPGYSGWGTALEHFLKAKHLG